MSRRVVRLHTDSRQKQYSPFTFDDVRFCVNCMCVNGFVRRGNRSYCARIYLFFLKVNRYVSGLFYFT